jgi:hypothetical protein
LAIEFLSHFPWALFKIIGQTDRGRLLLPSPSLQTPLTLRILRPTIFLINAYSHSRFRNRNRNTFLFEEAESLMLSKLDISSITK